MSRYGVFSGRYFSVLGMNTEIYGVNRRIQSKYRKYGPEKIPYSDTFHSLGLTKKQAFCWAYSFNLEIFYGFVYTRRRTFVFTYILGGINDIESMPSSLKSMFVSYHFHQPVQIPVWKCAGVQTSTWKPIRAPYPQILIGYSLFLRDSGWFFVDSWWGLHRSDRFTFYTSRQNRFALPVRYEIKLQFKYKIISIYTSNI